MQYAVFDDMTQCSAAEVARLLPLAHTQRQEQALRYQHVFGQFCCLKAYEMLLSLLSEAGYPMPIGAFSYTEYGQPYLPQGPFFSISHCRQGVAVAIDNRPVGIDIESIRPLRQPLIEKVMNPSEQARIAQSAQPEWEFARLWTRKEAFLKLQGTGIIANMKDTLESCPNVSFRTLDNTEGRYALSIASTL